MAADYETWEKNKDGYPFKVETDSTGKTVRTTVSPGMDGRGDYRIIETNAFIERRDTLVRSRKYPEINFVFSHE